MRVLFVNADPSVAHAISVMLKDSGIVADHVHSGQEAIGLAQRRTYAVILFDLALRSSDPFTTLDLLHRSCRAPVLALGASRQTQERMRALDAGAAEYLARPFERTELIECLRAMTGRDSIPPPAPPQASVFHRTHVARTGAFGGPLPSSAAWD